ncbi:hypothetical protein KI387_042999, partial [Taxus chinensis]
VSIVEETNAIDWCDQCFMPHAPYEEDQQEEEELYFDDNDDDVYMMGCSTSLQQG